MAGQLKNSLAEHLNKIMTLVAQAMTSPDVDESDLQRLAEMQGQLIGFIQEANMPKGMSAQAGMDPAMAGPGPADPLGQGGGGPMPGMGGDPGMGMGMDPMGGPPGMGMGGPPGMDGIPPELAALGLGGGPGATPVSGSMPPGGGGPGMGGQPPNMDEMRRMLGG